MTTRTLISMLLALQHSMNFWASKIDRQDCFSPANIGEIHKQDLGLEAQLPRLLLLCFLGESIGLLPDKIPCREKAKKCVMTQDTTQRERKETCHDKRYRAKRTQRNVSYTDRIPLE